MRGTYGFRLPHGLTREGGEIRPNTDSPQRGERTYPPEGGERRSPCRRNFVRNFFDKGIVASTSVPHGLSWTTLYK